MYVGLCIYDNLCMYVRMYESMYARILYNSSIIMQCYQRPLSFTDERRTTVCFMPGYHPTLLFCLPTFLPPVCMVAAKKSHFRTEKSGLAQNHRGNDSSLNCDNGRTNPLMNRSLETQQQPTCDRLLDTQQQQAICDRLLEQQPPQTTCYQLLEQEQQPVCDIIIRTTTAHL